MRSSATPSRNNRITHISLNFMNSLRNEPFSLPNLGPRCRRCTLSFVFAPIESERAVQAGQSFYEKSQCHIVTKKFVPTSIIKDKEGIFGRAESSLLFLLPLFILPCERVNDFDNPRLLVISTRLQLSFCFRRLFPSCFERNHLG